MSRRFRQHYLRSVTRLEGIWDFAFLGDVNPDAVEAGSIEFTDRMAVPGCFDATPAYAGRRGLTAYRKKIVLTDQPHRLILDGVHHWCRIFVDGKPLRDHAGGFTRFGADITDHQDGLVDLVVLVDNRFDYERCPLDLEFFDWYHFGGIARAAELHQLGAVWIDSLRVVTDDYAKRRITVSIDYAAVASPGKTELVVTFDGLEILSEKVDLVESAGRIERTFELSDAALWSPDEPNLHMLAVRLGDDDMCERVGIRQVSTSGQDILINGQTVRLLGVNRHEMHGDFGSAMPDALLVADVQQLRNMGCNFVRGSHYPQDPRFLDLCDETGICVWSESIGWQCTAEQLTDEHFIQAELTHIDEMVAATANSPSLIMWGVLNEGHSDDPECRPAYEKFLTHLRKLDPTRPVTYATDRTFKDVCYDLADIISINCYPGWYEGRGSLDAVPAELDRITKHLDSVGQGDKPLIISEIGAGAIYGWRDINEDRWTEQYQAKLLESAIRHMFIDRSRVCGLAIWQFCDCRGSRHPLGALITSPRGFNNKGLVDEYRRPKLAYDAVKQLFNDISAK